MEKTGRETTLWQNGTQGFRVLKNGRLPSLWIERMFSVYGAGDRIQDQGMLGKVLCH